MKNKILSFVVFCVLFSTPCWGDDCLTYKLNPHIDIKTPVWSKEVVQPIKPMDLWHGNVIATLVDNYEIIGDTTSIEDGFCISLKSVQATVGYSDFLVQIDSRHVPETCSYDAVLTHEDEHIRAYLSVIDDYKDDLQQSVYSAANSVMPLFVKTEEEIDAAMDALNKNLQSHPDLILIKQKIKTEEEIRNKRIDQNDTGADLKKCFINSD